MYFKQFLTNQITVTFAISSFPVFENVEWIYPARDIA
jgi:hypothetical protein